MDMHQTSWGSLLSPRAFGGRAGPSTKKVDGSRGPSHVAPSVELSRLGSGAGALADGTSYMKSAVERKRLSGRSTHRT